MIGQYIELHINGKKRPYNPISRIDEAGQVDFLITDLRKLNGQNSFTNHILSMNVCIYIHRKMIQFNCVGLLLNTFIEAMENFNGLESHSRNTKILE